MSDAIVFCKRDHCACDSVFSVFLSDIYFGDLRYIFMVAKRLFQLDADKAGKQAALFIYNNNLLGVIYERISYMLRECVAYAVKRIV